MLDANREAPYVLLPYQQRWHNDDSRVRVAEKSRRIGFSWAAAAEVALEASEENGCDVWYVGYNKEMAQEFIRDVVFWSRYFQLTFTESLVDESGDPVEGDVFIDGDETGSVLTYTVRYDSGFRVTALSSEPSNLRYKKGHIIIDEAAHHDDFKGLLKAAMAILMWGGRSRVDVISTHNGIDNEFNKYIEDIRSGKKKGTIHRVTIHNAIDEGFVERIALTNGVTDPKEVKAYVKNWIEETFAFYGDDAKEELEVIPFRSGGVYITRRMIERVMIHPGKVLRLELNDDFLHGKTESQQIRFIEGWCSQLDEVLLNLDNTLPHFFGQDFGRVSDRTVIPIGYLSQDLKKKFPLVIEMSNVPFERQKQVLFYTLRRIPKLFAGAMDATGNGAHLAEVTQQEFGEDRIELINLSDKWYAENLPKLRSAFEDRELEIVRDLDHLNDLASFRRIHGVPKLPKLKTKSVGKGPPRHGDAGIAYLLAHYAGGKGIGEYAYTPVKESRTNKAGFGGSKQRGLY